MIEASKIGDTESVNKLLKAGVKPDHAGGWPNVTALHYASKNGFLEIVKLLMQYGAAVKYDRSEKSQFREYELPLAGAIIGDHLDVVEFLILNGADPTELIHASDLSFTGISLALAHKKTEIIKLFKSHCGQDVVEEHVKRKNSPLTS